MIHQPEKFDHLGDKYIYMCVYIYKLYNYIYVYIIIYIIIFIYTHSSQSNSEFPSFHFFQIRIMLANHVVSRHSLALVLFPQVLDQHNWPILRSRRMLMIKPWEQWNPGWLMIVDYYRAWLLTTIHWGLSWIITIHEGKPYQPTSIRDDTGFFIWFLQHWSFEDTVSKVR